MGAAVLPLAIASAGISAYGAYAQGQAQSNAAQYQAAVARNNAVIAQSNAGYAMQRGQILEQQKRQQTAQMIGSERASAGAAGIDVQSGSALRLQSDTAKLGEMDALTIRNSAAREAYGYTVQGMSYGAQAGLDEQQAQYAAQAGDIGALSSLIGGASKIAPKWGSIFGSSTTGDGGA